MPRSRSHKQLPKIELKYFRHLDRKTKSQSGVSCYWCKDSHITIGGGFQNDQGTPVFICEECAVKRYMQLNNIESYEIAHSRRRRVFDIEYLFQEIVIDTYLVHRAIDFQQLDNYMYSVLIELGQEIYRDEEVITPQEKRYLEERVHQTTIEKHINRILGEIDLDFEQLPTPSPFVAPLLMEDFGN